MNCKVFAEKLNDYINNELTENEAIEMRMHIEKCDTCNNMFQEEIEIDNLFKSALENNEAKFKSQKSNIMEAIDESKYKNIKIDKLKDRKYYLKRASLIAAAFAFIFILNKERLNLRMGNNYEMSADDSAIEKATEQMIIENKANTTQESKSNMAGVAEDSTYGAIETIIAYVNKEQFNSIMINENKYTEDGDRVKFSGDLKYKAIISENSGIFIEFLQEKDFKVLNIQFVNENAKIYDAIFNGDYVYMIVGDIKQDGGNKIYSYNMINGEIRLELEEISDNQIIVNFEKGNNDSIMIIKKKVDIKNGYYNFEKEIMNLEN